VQKMVYGQGKRRSRALCEEFATFSPPHSTFVLRRVSLNTLAHSRSLRWSCRTFSSGLLAVSSMPSHLPPSRRDQSRVPFPPARSLARLPRYCEPLGLPLGSVPSGLIRPVFALTRLPARVSPVPHSSVQTCRRLQPRRSPTGVLVQPAVCCLRRDMTVLALSNAFRLKK
jgi:hypothetical protein